VNRALQLASLFAFLTTLLLFASAAPFVQPIAASGPPGPIALPPIHFIHPSGEGGGGHPLCEENAYNCTERRYRATYEGHYIGHDEPAIAFYSDVAGSGNSSVYQMALPIDPPKKPLQDGSGGTWNFQLHPAFWFGMALCDSESFPEYTHTCVPDSDDNIYDDYDPSSPRYNGKHPGAAFLEVQLYAPGWAPWPPGASCDATKWCASLHINSFLADAATFHANSFAKPGQNAQTPRLRYFGARNNHGLSSCYGGGLIIWLIVLLRH